MTPVQLGLVGETLAGPIRRLCLLRWADLSKIVWADELRVDHIELATGTCLYRWDGPELQAKLSGPKPWILHLRMSQAPTPWQKLPPRPEGYAWIFQREGAPEHWYILGAEKGMAAPQIQLSSLPGVVEWSSPALAGCSPRPLLVWKESDLGPLPLSFEEIYRGYGLFPHRFVLEGEGLQTLSDARWQGYSLPILWEEGEPYPQLEIPAGPPASGYVSLRNQKGLVAQAFTYTRF